MKPWRRPCAPRRGHEPVAGAHRRSACLARRRGSSGGRRRGRGRAAESPGGGIAALRGAGRRWLVGGGALGEAGHPGGFPQRTRHAGRRPRGQRGRLPGSVRLPGQAQPARAPLRRRGGRAGGPGRLGRAPRGLPWSRGGVHAADVRERGLLGGGGQHDRLARPGGLVRPDRGTRASERGGPDRRRAGARGRGSGGDRGRSAGGRQCGRLRGDGGAPRGGAGRRSHPDAGDTGLRPGARGGVSRRPLRAARDSRGRRSRPRGGGRSPASGPARRGCRCMPRSS